MSALIQSIAHAKAASVRNQRYQHKAKRKAGQKFSLDGDVNTVS